MVKYGGTPISNCRVAASSSWRAGRSQFSCAARSDGRVVGELHGLATDAEGHSKPIGNLESDRLKLHEYSEQQFHRPDFAQAELASGDQATIMNLWNAARAAGAKMNELDIQYPWMGLGKNSDAFASTLIAAMGLTEPQLPGGARITPSAGSMLLDPSAIQAIQRQFKSVHPVLKMIRTRRRWQTDSISRARRNRRCPALPSWMQKDQRQLVDRTAQHLWHHPLCLVPARSATATASATGAPTLPRRLRISTRRRFAGSALLCWALSRLIRTSRHPTLTNRRFSPCHRLRARGLRLRRC
jgi:hypothetical protein